MAKVKLRIEKREDGWWVVDSPDEDANSGPFKTKAEAHEEKMGLERFWNVLWPNLQANLQASKQ